MKKKLPKDKWAIQKTVRFTPSEWRMVRAQIKDWGQGTLVKYRPVSESEALKEMIISCL